MSETTKESVKVKFTDLKPGERFTYSQDVNYPYDAPPVFMKTDSLCATCMHSRIVVEFKSEDQQVEVMAIDRPTT